MTTLKADKQYLLTRLETAELQTSRAKYELRNLRSFLLDRVRPRPDRSSRKRRRQAEPDEIATMHDQEHDALPVPAPTGQIIEAGNQSNGPSEASHAATVLVDDEGEVITGNQPQEAVHIEGTSPAGTNRLGTEHIDMPVPERKGRRVTMGDAETEHLLLAASRLTRVRKAYNHPSLVIPTPRYVPYSMAFPEYPQPYQPHSPNGQYADMSSVYDQTYDFSNNLSYVESERKQPVPGASDRVLRSKLLSDAKPPISRAKTPIMDQEGSAPEGAQLPRKIGRPRGSPNKTKLIPLNETVASQRRMKALENAMLGKPRGLGNGHIDVASPVPESGLLSIGSRMKCRTTAPERTSSERDRLGNGALSSQGSGFDLLLAAQDMHIPYAGSAAPEEAAVSRHTSRSASRALDSATAHIDRAVTEEYPDDDDDDYFLEADDDEEAEEEEEPVASTSRVGAVPHNGSSAAAERSSLGQNVSGLDVLAEQATGQGDPGEAASGGGGAHFSALGAGYPASYYFPPTPASTAEAGQQMGSSAQLTIQEQLALGVDSTHHLIDPRDLKKGMTPAAALAKKARSPYLKWTADEDEKLILGVSEHGTRWDEVAKRLPTRSYHQCRQRWLRGLKCTSMTPSKLLTC